MQNQIKGETQVSNNITKLIGIKELNIKKVESTDKEIILHATLKQFKPEICSHYESKKIHYHDKRIQNLKDILYHKPVIIILERRRYKCYDCNKKIEIKPTFIEDKKQMTTRLIREILKKTKPKKHKRNSK